MPARGPRSASTVAGVTVGELERDVLNALWQQSAPVGAREVRSVLQPRKSLAYTTVMTVLVRLVAKGLVERQWEGRRYVYQATTPDQLAARAIDKLLAAASNRRAVLAHFVRDPVDRALLVELAQAAEGAPSK